MVTAVGLTPEPLLSTTINRLSSNVSGVSDRGTRDFRKTGESLARESNPIADLKQLFTDYNIKVSSDKPNSPQDIFNILSQISASIQNLSQQQKLSFRSKFETPFVSLLTNNFGFTPDKAKKEVGRVLNRIIKGPKAVDRLQKALMKIEGASEQFMNTFNEVSNKLASLASPVKSKLLSSYNDSKALAA